LNQTVAIIGGDLRIVELAEMLTKDKFQINTYALEKAESLKKVKQIKECINIEETLQNATLVIGPIPLSSNRIEINTPLSEKTIALEELVLPLKGKKMMAGNIPKEFRELLKKQGIITIDLLEREELVVLNTIATAEGAIQIAMEETRKTIYKSNVLVLGFGRVGKILANKLKAMNANVYCEARSTVDLAWIKAYGYEPIALTELKEKLNQFDIIMNTIPTLVLGEEELAYLKKDCLIIELASNPGGIDKEIAEKKGIRRIDAPGLPGKVAPRTSAEFIKDTIYQILKENEK